MSDMSESNFELFCALKGTEGNIERIVEVIKDFKALTRRQLQHTLRELASGIYTAHIALRAAIVMREPNIANHTAHVISKNIYASSDAQSEAAAYVRSRK